MSASGAESKKEKNPVLLILAAAAALRLAYAWAASGVPPWNDMAVYDAARLAIMNCEPYPAAWPPLYPAFLAAVSYIFGNGYMFLYAAQAILSTVTCLLIYLIAKETFGRTAALIALSVSAVYVDMIWYSAVLMAETMGILFLVLTVYLALKRFHPALSGAVLGLACLTKGACLIALPAICAWNVFRFGLKAGALNSLKLVAVLLLVILPWTVHNYKKYNSFVLLEPHIGLSMLIGHNPSATGGCDYYFVEEEYGKFYGDPGFSIIQKDAIAKKYAINYILTNPARELQLFALKLSKYWSFRTHFDMNNGPYPLKKWLFFSSMLMHMFIFPAFIFGAVFSLDNRDGLVSLLMIAVYTLVFTLLFSAFGRMRFPLVPFIIILAAKGAVTLPELAARIRSGNAAGIKGKLAIACSLVAVMYANFIYQAISKYGDVAGRFG